MSSQHNIGKLVGGLRCRLKAMAWVIIWIFKITCICAVLFSQRFSTDQTYFNPPNFLKNNQQLSFSLFDYFSLGVVFSVCYYLCICVFFLIANGRSQNLKVKSVRNTKIKHSKEKWRGKEKRTTPGYQFQVVQKPSWPAGVIGVGYPSLKALRNIVLLFVKSFPTLIYSYRLGYWAVRSYFPLSSWWFICKTLNHGQICKAVS